MINRMAAAMYMTMPFGERGWDDCSSYTRQRCIDCARAALAAMREPTEAMTRAGWAKIEFLHFEPAEFAEAWRAVIDAALNSDAKPA
jgi:hypothetical protein